MRQRSILSSYVPCGVIDNVLSHKDQLSRRTFVPLFPLGSLRLLPLSLRLRLLDSLRRREVIEDRIYLRHTWPPRDRTKPTLKDIGCRSLRRWGIGGKQPCSRCRTDATDDASNRKPGKIVRASRFSETHRDPTADSAGTKRMSLTNFAKCLGNLGRSRPNPRRA